jgi:hypothetical protein
MARTNIVAQSLIGAYPALPIAPGGADPSLTSTTDPTDRVTALIDSKTVVLAHNSDTAPHTITFTSALDSLNRAGDITAYQVDAGDISIFGPFKAVGWQQSGALLFIDTSDPHVQLAVITLP